MHFTSEIWTDIVTGRQRCSQPQPTTPNGAKMWNEAKLNTSWIQPNEEWLAATRDFVAKILEPSMKNKFLPTFLPVAQEIARLGAVNALAQALLKLTSPGVPDIYQGNEVWNYSLVDPDNRC